MVGYAVYLKNKKPEWLELLLNSKFFDSCENHQELRKNEVNVFCIDCKCCLCQHCLCSSSSSSSSSSDNHSNHKLLQIRRYVYRDVVRLRDMQKYLDCSSVQPYSTNGAKVGFLQSRPHSKPSKPNSGSVSCLICNRTLTDPYRFCSIACMVSLGLESATRKSIYDQCNSAPAAENGDRESGGSLSSPTMKETKEEDSMNSTVTVSAAEGELMEENQNQPALLGKRKRKNRFPCRAPLF